MGDIALLFAVWSVVAFVLQIPTGVLADRCSRRHLLAVAQLVRAAGFTLWWVAPGFTGYAVGFALWGLQGAMTSGAFEALVYDELHAHGEDDRYARVMGLGEAWSSAGAVLGSVLAAAVVPLGFDVILLASVVASALTALCAWSLPAAARAVPTDGERYVDLLGEGVREVLARRSLLLFVVFAGVGVGVGAVEEFYGLVLADAGVDRAGISLWHAAFFAVAIGGSLLAHRAANVPMLRLAGLTALMGVTLAGIVIVPDGMAAPLLVTFQALYSVQYVALDARLQSMISTRARATVTSVQGFVTELAALATFLGVGAVAGGSSTAVAAGAAGVVLVVGAAAHAATTTNGLVSRRRGRLRAR